MFFHYRISLSYMQVHEHEQDYFGIKCLDNRAIHRDIQVTRQTKSPVLHCLDEYTIIEEVM